MSEPRPGAVAAVLFDMDGLLIDTERIWEAARERITREAGGTWPADAQARMMGMSTPEWTQWMHDELGVRLTPTQIRDAVLERLERGYRERVPLMPGARDAVGRMGARWPLAVASSSPRRLLEVVLAETGLEPHFAA
ncbi:MAG: HAD family hydrolase, partial [Solirubrobacterales bacterium]